MSIKRQLHTIVAMALGLASGAALSAEIENLSGQSCGTFLGTWHFVNNQTGGAGAGSLTATFQTSDGVVTCGPINPSAVNKNTQHFLCQSSGTLTGASTTLQGRLLLSDFSCQDIKEPPCDPNKKDCK